ncbi:hypothetical protein MK904_10230 [Loigolactobacillus coryniformis]|uniref:hypothetical protein n=1 Tax=Loigolactobacillus coryniformis TaxID=1610 RepID=UPI002341D75F|nr:hypothetical protein [Loigolactobacillus coryniformis]MDC4186478.1 hypothetical protein [Loigolactobacillus coryniformis]
MIKVKKSKISRLTQTIISVLPLNLKKYFYGIIGVLTLVPIIFIAYLLLNANLQSMDVLTLMEKQPYIAVMVIVAGLDIITGYIMWMARADILASRQTFRLLVTAIMIQQLAVSNFVIGIGATIALLLSYSLPDKPMKHPITLVLPLLFLTLCYALCLVLFTILLNK